MALTLTAQVCFDRVMNPLFLYAFPQHLRAEVRLRMIEILQDLIDKHGTLTYADHKHCATVNMDHRVPRAWTLLLTYHRNTRREFIKTVVYTIVNKRTGELDQCDVFEQTSAPLHPDGYPCSVNLYSYFNRVDRSPFDVDDWHIVEDTETQEEDLEESDEEMSD